MKMSRMAIPHHLTEWLSSWFINRTDRLQMNSSIGHSRTFKEGLNPGLRPFTPPFHNLHKRSPGRI